jgi:transcriptional regulator with XRE-family HTH domain
MTSKVKDQAPAAKASAMSVFSRQLRAWREKKGWSQVDLSGKLRYSNTLISEVEGQRKPPSAEFAARCDEAFDTPGTFAGLQELVAREAWPSYFAPVIDYEGRATQMHEWEQRVVPGLLQTEDYARSVISAGQPRLSEAETERRVTGRLSRQEILARESGRPMYWSVIHEGVLRHCVGGGQTMQGQLDKLIQASATPDVILQVLPYSAKDHPGTDGPIQVFDFADAPSAGYTECNGGGMIVETPADVTTLMTRINLIRAVALAPRESRELLRKIRDEI